MDKSFGINALVRHILSWPLGAAARASAGGQAASAPPPGDAFIFQDAERSNVTLLRRAVRRAPERYAVLFLLFVGFWTVVMSYGAGVHSNNGIALNLTPHVSLYCAALGLFIYPIRMFWIPLLAFGMVFVYQVINPFVHTEPWYSNPALTPSTLMIFFIMNAASALVIGGLMRWLFSAASRSFRPHIGDLLLSLGAYFIFITVCFAQLWVTLWMFADLTTQAQQDLGFSAGLSAEVATRILRGGVVLTAFLLAAIEIPSWREWLLGFGAGLLLPALGAAQFAGAALYPMLDTALLAIVLVMVLPVPAGITACIIGFPLYAALTGNYITVLPYNNSAERLLEYYASAALFMIVFVLIFRSSVDHDRRALRSGMRRMERARAITGAGLFSANMTAQFYQLDEDTAQRLNIAPQGPLANLLQRVDIKNRDELTDVLSQQHKGEQTVSLILRLHNDSGAEEGRAPLETEQIKHAPPMLAKLSIWGETSPFGDVISYGVLQDLQNNDADAFRHISLIVAEDNPIVGEVICARLQPHIPNLRLAQNGREVLEMWEEEPADVVLSDLIMPEIAGDQLIEQLRDMGFYGLIVGLSANNAPEQAQRFWRAGADGVMSKPLDVAQFLEMVAKHLSSNGPQMGLKADQKPTSDEKTSP